MTAKEEKAVRKSLDRVRDISKKREDPRCMASELCCQPPLNGCWDVVFMVPDKRTAPSESQHQVLRWEKYAGPIPLKGDVMMLPETLTKYTSKASENVRTVWVVMVREFHPTDGEVVLEMRDDQAPFPD